MSPKKCLPILDFLKVGSNEFSIFKVLSITMKVQLVKNFIQKRYLVNIYKKRFEKNHNTTILEQRFCKKSQVELFLHCFIWKVVNNDLVIFI